MAQEGLPPFNGPFTPLAHEGPSTAVLGP